jgi:hypothetical protein
MSPSEAASGLVVELAEEFLDRYRKGERPALREYIARHPELAAEINEVFPAMAMLENIARADESSAAPSARSLATPPLQQLGDYRIIREIGRGGMGVVYEAEQVSLGRHVALKVLLRQVRDGRQRQRFEREARAAARLHHTNIVPVFGVGEQDGQPYYVMHFIQGLGLDAVLTELKRLRGNTPKSQTVSGRTAPGRALRRRYRYRVESGQSTARLGRSRPHGEDLGREQWSRAAHLDRPQRHRLGRAVYRGRRPGGHCRLGPIGPRVGFEPGL